MAGAGVARVRVVSGGKEPGGRGGPAGAGSAGRGRGTEAKLRGRTEVRGVRVHCGDRGARSAEKLRRQINEECGDSAETEVDGVRRLRGDRGCHGCGETAEIN
jgi:hypothetical protein